MNWEYVVWGLAFGLASFGASAVTVTALLVSLPSVFFLDSHVRHLWIDQHRVVRLIGVVLKNLLGLFLILLGGVLSVPGVPGQGILTILLGIVLLDFPGKRRVERAILARPRIRTAVDRLRARFGKEPFVLEEVP